MKTARIFEEVTGKWHICDDAADCLDARGRGYASRRDAITALRRDVADGDPSAFTHYLDASGSKRKIKPLYE